MDGSRTWAGRARHCARVLGPAHLVARRALASCTVYSVPMSAHDKTHRALTLKHHTTQTQRNSTSSSTGLGQGSARAPVVRTISLVRRLLARESPATATPATHRSHELKMYKESMRVCAATRVLSTANHVLARQPKTHPSTVPKHSTGDMRATCGLRASGQARWASGLPERRDEDGF